MPANKFSSLSCFVSWFKLLCYYSIYWINSYFFFFNKNRYFFLFGSYACFNLCTYSWYVIFVKNYVQNIYIYIIYYTCLLYFYYTCTFDWPIFAFNSEYSFYCPPGFSATHCCSILCVSLDSMRNDIAFYKFFSFV